MGLTLPDYGEDYPYKANPADPLPRCLSLHLWFQWVSPFLVVSNRRRLICDVRLGKIMENIISIAKWLFLESIYGIAVITVVIYFLAIGIKKVIPNSPNPAVAGAFVFVATLFTLPSIPRYQFEDESLSKIQEKDWIRVINKTKWGSITEPLTWFRAPIGSIFIVMPNSPMEGGYREVLLRYEEEPRVTMSDPDCTDNTILYSEPDKQGVFRYTSVEAQPMTEQEVSIYCEYDWSKEKEALISAMQNQVNPK